MVPNIILSAYIVLFEANTAYLNVASFFLKFNMIVVLNESTISVAKLLRSFCLLNASDLFLYLCILCLSSMFAFCICSCDTCSYSRVGSSDFTGLQGTWKAFKDSGHGHYWRNQFKRWYHAFISTCSFACWNTWQNSWSCKERCLRSKRLLNAYNGRGML